jgi:hypothetical protein
LAWVFLGPAWAAPCVFFLGISWGVWIGWNERHALVIHYSRLDNGAHVVTQAADSDGQVGFITTAIDKNGERQQPRMTDDVRGAMRIHTEVESRLG